ncbi:MAG: hotdog fold thioesterase [Clostridia bacterium]|jgi:acyl-CoA thioesterase|nr:hotdog fold thioesterase [Clostridia bacterium]
MDLTEQELKEFLNKDRFAQFIGLKLLEVKPGYAVTQVEIQEHHLNGFDHVQGGLTFTLADLAFAAAANSHGRASVGINVSICYFEAPKGKILTATARELHKNAKLAGYDVDVVDELGTPVAKFTGLVYRKKQTL